MRRLFPFFSLMLLLCSARAEQIKVSVEAYNRVSVEGSCADQLSVSYIQKQSSPYKCRLSRGDTAVLRMEGLPDATLGMLTLSMRSNKSSGSGNLTLRLDGRTVWQIADASFASDDWYGAYSDTYVPISHQLNEPSGLLELTIVATANSIYFSSLTLEYTPLVPVAHTVALDCGTGARYWLTESAPEAGIVLPRPDEVNDYWQPIGWTEAPLSQQTDCPLFYAPGATYYPARDTELHALYRAADGLQQIAPEANGLSGEYLIAFGAPFSLMADGAVVDKAIAALPCEAESGLLIADHAASSARYRLIFEGDSVEISHPASGTWLGHTDAALSRAASRWKWQPAAGGSVCFSFASDRGELCLLPKDESLDLFSLAANDPAANAHAFLFPAESLPLEPQSLVYTSYPLSGVGLSDTSAAPRAEKRFLDGRIVILAPDGRFFDLLGRPICADAL